MVIALGPGKFYGSSLPRPRIYTDVKFNSERVDPPVSVIDPFMSWAEEAHWSMGGLSFNRHRLQGRIEGNVDKLRHQIESSIKQKSPNLPKKGKKAKNKFVSKSVEKLKASDLSRSRSPSPPAAPLANKRKRRYLGLVDDDDEDEVNLGRKWPVRKLADEFDLVAGDEKSVASRTRGKKVVVEEMVKKTKKRLRKVKDA